jgi:hypothetical protein
MVKIHKNKRKRLYSNYKESLTCLEKSITAKIVNLHWRNSRWKLNPISKNNHTDASCTKCVVGLCCIISLFSTTWVICSFFKGKQ